MEINKKKSEDIINTQVYHNLYIIVSRGHYLTLAPLLPINFH